MQIIIYFHKYQGRVYASSYFQENKGKIDELEEQRVKLEAKVCDEEANYETAMATLKQETQVN